MEDTDEDEKEEEDCPPGPQTATEENIINFVVMCGRAWETVYRQRPDRPSSYIRERSGTG